MTLVEHARRELKLLGEDKDVVDWYLKVVQAYSDFGHSGGSAEATLPVLCDLLQFKNLKPLTDNPSEWQFHNGDIWPPDGIWQNIRNSTAFSHDGGKTYWMLPDDGRSLVAKDEKTFYTSESSNKEL